MLIEVKAKVAEIIDGKTKRKTKTYIVPDCELFVNAEHTVMSLLASQQNDGLVERSEILSLRQSPIKEVADQFDGELTFIATLKDIFQDDNGNEKSLKYKVLLWANSHSEALHNIQELAREGYDMHIEGIKEVDYDYLQPLVVINNQENNG